MVLIENRYGYLFDPETMYQPAIPDIEYFDDGLCRFYPDGHVQSLDQDWELETSTYKGWNNYCQAGGWLQGVRQGCEALLAPPPK